MHVRELNERVFQVRGDFGFLIGLYQNPSLAGSRSYDRKHELNIEIELAQISEGQKIFT